VAFVTPGQISGRALYIESSTAIPRAMEIGPVYDKRRDVLYVALRKK
jgi:hypothetical protein